MKLNRLETHDRLEYLIKDQSSSVQQGAEDCLKKNPYSLRLQAHSPYVYLYAHARTHDNGVDKVLYWAPRLSKPPCEPNSYLFRAHSHSDVIEIMWMLPQQEMWSQYKMGNVTENGTVLWSINQYRVNKVELEKPEPKDLPEEKCKMILLDIAREMEEDIRMRKLYVKDNI